MARQQITGHHIKAQQKNWSPCQDTTYNWSPWQDTTYNWSPCQDTTYNWSHHVKTTYNWSPCQDTPCNWSSYCQDILHITGHHVKIQCIIHPTLCYWSPHFQDAIHNRSSLNKWSPYQDTLHMTALTTMTRYTAVLYMNACQNKVTSDLLYFTTLLVCNQFHFHHIIQLLQHNIT